MKSYYVNTENGTIYTKTFNGALGYLIGNLPDVVIEDDPIAIIGTKELTPDEFEKLPEFKEESRKVEELFQELNKKNN